QLAKGAVAHVEKQPEAVGLDEVARTGRFRGRERPRAADDGELHEAETSVGKRAMDGKPRGRGTALTGVVRFVERKTRMRGSLLCQGPLWANSPVVSRVRLDR